MVLNISADDRRRDLVTYCPSNIALFPEFPAPEATLHAWKRTQDSPGTQTLAPRDDLRARVAGWEGAQDVDMIWTHLHFLSRNVILLGTVSTKLPDPLLSLAWQDITALLGRPDQVVQRIVDGMGCASEDHPAIVHPQPAFDRGH